MSKLRSELIQKIYKEDYLCKEGHNVVWHGSQYVYSDLVCAKCGKPCKNENPIRWSCSKCNTFFCSNCFRIIMDKICPSKHKYKFYKQLTVDSFSYYTCDICSKRFDNMEGILHDKECNITICPKCFIDSCDVPEVLED